MSEALFEHVNMTVTDPDKTASMLSTLFGWHVRWSGASKGAGYTVHVGTDTLYVALYRPSPETGVEKPEEDGSYSRAGAVNHLGILVDDLEEAEARVLELGIKTHSHQTYDPGSRFYFHDEDGIEYEVVSYA
ncbi:MAG: VOC family protein [Hyphomonadaceae bacterium]|nr:VOC family protein [Hyphomonadaceae bacterium]